MVLTDLVIISYDDNFKVDSLAFPSKSSEFSNRSIDEVAIKTIPEIRASLDQIDLGVSKLEELITYEKADQKVETTQEFVIKPNYSKIEAIYKEIQNDNIEINVKIDPETKRKTLYTIETPAAFLKRVDFSKYKEKYRFDYVLKKDLPINYQQYLGCLNFDKEQKRVFVDIESGKVRKLQHIRNARNKKLEQLDKELMIAERDKNKAKIKELHKKRKILLNVPQDCEKKLISMNSFEEIKELSHPALFDEKIQQKTMTDKVKNLLKI